MTSEILAAAALALGVLNTTWQLKAHLHESWLQRSAQARDIELIATPTFNATGGHVLLEVTNHGERPVYDVILSSADVVSEGPGNGSRLAAGQSKQIAARRFADGKLPFNALVGTACEVRFKDASGKRWLRRLDGSLLDLDKRYNVRLREVPWHMPAPPVVVPDGVPHAHNS